MPWKGLQTIARCYSLRPAAKWYGIIIAVFCFTPVTSLLSLSALAFLLLHSAHLSNTAHVHNNETTSDTPAQGLMNVFNFLLSVFFFCYFDIHDNETASTTTALRTIHVHNLIFLIALLSKMAVFTLAAPQQLKTAYSTGLVVLRQGTWQLILTVHIQKANM